MAVFDTTHMLHGGDYNPDQWLEYPEILDEDIRMMKQACINTVSLGIFSWAKLEPEEGVYDFGWLDRIIDRLYENGIQVILATPGAGRPAWLTQKYPETTLADRDGVRQKIGRRGNHCLESPVYREKVANINARLAEHYKDHPAIILWHVNNELNFECSCELCQRRFRTWLREKYGTLENLNRAWWTDFWSHTYTDWEQIQSPAPNGEYSIDGLLLDWDRFHTDSMIAYLKCEMEPLRRITPNIPVTTNMMGFDLRSNSRKIQELVDVISWDCYPMWHLGEDWRTAVSISCFHDLSRCYKRGKPYLLMESTPSVVSWNDVCRLKRPGMHRLASLQAVAHGSDSVMYFQWRKGRGGYEKFHGAVVGHNGRSDTRTFRDVQTIGRDLKKLDGLTRTTVRSQVAIMMDWENAWALNNSTGPRAEKDYIATCVEHYTPFWKMGVPVDIIGSDDDLDDYRLVIAPMFYLTKQSTSDRIRQFVENGGTFITTYLSGVVNETNLCYLGGFPGPLRSLTGVWVEETDTMHSREENCIVCEKEGIPGLNKEYSVGFICDIIHAEDAEVLGVYGRDFYRGTPVLTRKKTGNGNAYYLAARPQEDFLTDFYRAIVHEAGVTCRFNELPLGVTVQTREDEEFCFYFVLNFTQQEQTVSIGEGKLYDLLAEKWCQGMLRLPEYGVCVLQEKKQK